MWRRANNWLRKQSSSDPMNRQRHADRSSASRDRRVRSLTEDMLRLPQIAIRQLHVIPVPRGNGVSLIYKITMLTEFAGLGYRVVNPEALESASPELFLDYHAIIQTLVELRGGNIEYRPLFAGFPQRPPAEHENFVYPLIDYVANKPVPTTGSAGVALEIVSPEEAVRRLRAWVAAPSATRPDSQETRALAAWQADVAIVRRLLGRPVDHRERKADALRWPTDPDRSPRPCARSRSSWRSTGWLDGSGRTRRKQRGCQHRFKAYRLEVTDQ